MNQPSTINHKEETHPRTKDTMTKKRHALPSTVAPWSSNPSTIRHQFWLGLQLVVTLCVLFCLLLLLRIHSQYAYREQEEVAMVVDPPFFGTPKIAFLFLVRRSLPLDFVWHTFFQNADEGKFSIYVHSEPGFVFDESTTRSPFFYGRQLGRSVKVIWGEPSMIEAERLLLRAALEDPANQRFVLLSDSCVPLYNFSYIYNYLMSSPKSFVDSFLNKNDDRYNPKMSSKILKEKWRKGSQWITLVRKQAKVVATDEVIFSVFKKYCKRRPALDDEGKHNPKSKVQREHNCIPDEHYVQTLLSMREFEDEMERRTLTFTSWNKSTINTQKQNWHPLTFEYADASPRRIKEIKDISHVYYETENRNEWCQSNATAVPCFLFARKFSRGAAFRLLSEGLVGPFDAALSLRTS